MVFFLAFIQKSKNELSEITNFLLRIMSNFVPTSIFFIGIKHRMPAFVNARKCFYGCAFNVFVTITKANTFPRKHTRRYRDAWTVKNYCIGNNKWNILNSSKSFIFRLFQNYVTIRFHHCENATHRWQMANLTYFTRSLFIVHCSCVISFKSQQFISPNSKIRSCDHRKCPKWNKNKPSNYARSLSLIAFISFDCLLFTVYCSPFGSCRTGSFISFLYC